MKKSKLLRTTAKETLENVHLGQAAVEMEFKYRHDGPFTLKATRRCFTRYVKALRRDRIFLHAVEKQIPMPLKVQSIPQGKYNFPRGEVLYFVMKHFYCQNCGHEMLEDHYGDLASVKFCPYCGQKLWWPK